MAEPTLSIEYDDIANAVSLMLYGEDTYTDTSATEQARIAAIINAGYRSFLYPPTVADIPAGYRWKFLTPHTTMTTIAAQEGDETTGTIDVTTNVCTIAGGDTWPSWAATHGILTIANTAYPIVSRDSDTELTVTGDDVAAGEDDWVIQHNGNYTLPDDFGDIDDGFNFKRDENKPPVVGPVPESVILQKRADNDMVSYPRIFAIRILAVGAGATSQRVEVMFWPRTDAAYTLHYKYEALADAFGTGVYPIGTLRHMETLKESCLAEAELQLKDEYGAHYQKFLTLLKSSIERDRKSGANIFGYIGSANQYSGKAGGRTIDYTLTAGGIVIEG